MLAWMGSRVGASVGVERMTNMKARLSRLEQSIGPATDEAARAASIEFFEKHIGEQRRALVRCSMPADPDNVWGERLVMRLGWDRARDLSFVVIPGQHDDPVVIVEPARLRDIREEARTAINEADVMMNSYSGSIGGVQQGGHGRVSIQPSVLASEAVVDQLKALRAFMDERGRNNAA